MNLEHINIKLFLDGELTADLDQVVKVFHKWVAEQSMPEMMIDVADYRHVPSAPSIVLVGLEADYALDNTGGKYGLVYNRKAAVDGNNEEKILAAFRAASDACRRLEEAVPALKFRRNAFEFLVNDRAIAPNNADSRQACSEIIANFLQNQLGHTEFEMSADEEPRRRVKIQVELANELDLAQLAS